MTLLFLNQTFYPDVMASGQYLTEVAVRLVERGHQVTVITSRRAYDNPRQLFRAREMWRGVNIIRLRATAFGKGAKWRRALDFASFFVCCFLRLVFMPRVDVVVGLTSPPLISALGAWFARRRGGRFVYWVLDLNPDEAIAAGWLRANSLSARVLEGMSRFSLVHSDRIIALDRFMRDRLLAKRVPADRVAVIPPWSLDGDVRFDPEGRARFRAAHDLEGRFVVMYSGNHSPCHPLDTLLAAAERLADDPAIVFCFIGGGSEWGRIRRICEARHKDSATAVGRNLVCLGYEPLSGLAGSLSAADLQVVVMGDGLVGLVHACKVYNLLELGVPVLYIGPRPSHVTEVFEVVGKTPGGHRQEPGSGVGALANGRRFTVAGHGEVDRVVEHIRQARAEWGSSPARLPRATAHPFGREAVLPRLIAELESGMGASGASRVERV